MSQTEDDPPAYLGKWNLQRAVRHRASNRGFQIICVRGREGQRREALGLGPYMLIDTEKMHLFTATLEEIEAFIADKPEVITPLHDKHDYQRRRQLGLATHSVRH